MKLVRTLLALVLATSSATVLTGCSKSADTAPLEHEAVGLVKLYERKFAHLDQRRTALEERAKKLAGLKQEGTAASNFAAASGQLAKLLEKTRSAPAELAAFAKGSAARVSLISRTGDLKRELGEGFIVVNAAFDAYETYLTRVESGGDVASAAPLPAGSTGATDPHATPNPHDPATTSPPSPSGDVPPSSSTQGGPAQKSPGGGN